MLKKLYKYDWKSVSLLLLSLHGILLVYSLIGRLGLVFSSSAKGTAFNMISSLYLMLYVFFIIGVITVTFLYLAIRTQKNLFSDEGYLTHTLPVSPQKILLSKLFIFWTWTLIDLVCVIISVFILVANKDTLPVLKDTVTSAVRIITGYYGVSEQISSVFILLTAIVQYLGYYTTLLLFSLCLGNLFKNHKILGSVISFFGVHVVMTLINTAVAFSSFSLEVQTNRILPQSAFFIFTFVWNLLFSFIFFFGSRYILSKKLNLA